MLIDKHIPYIFREYDIRGVFGSILNEEMAYLIGKAMAIILNEAGHSAVIVARDGRHSGEILCSSLIQGLISSAIDIVDLGCVTTPMAYFATHVPLLISGVKRSISSCVVVTGSHNPPEYNGFKIVIENKALHGKSIKKLWDLINLGKFLSGMGRFYSYDIFPTYCSVISKSISLARPIDVVLDAGNGIAGIFASRIFEAIGCRVKPLFCDFDANFPNHHPDPSCYENLKDLKNCLLKEKFEVGLAFDGDGDRLGVVCQDGEVIELDRLLMLFSQNILMSRPGSSIVFDVKCSKMLDHWIVCHSGCAIMCRSGHSLVKSEMRLCHALLGGEKSGHLFFADRWYGFDDGFYAGARLLELLSLTKDMAILMKDIPRSSRSPEYKIACPEGEKKAWMILVKNHAIFDGMIQKNEIDGLRVEYRDGFGLIRASNTIPALVMHFEGSNKFALNRIKRAFKNTLMKILPCKKWPY